MENKENQKENQKDDFPTAVEWLEKEIKIYLPSIHNQSLIDAFNKAKEFEKREHKRKYVDAAKLGYIKGFKAAIETLNSVVPSIEKI